MVLLLFLLTSYSNFKGISTPIIGKVSDNTRTRLGRRRPWIIGGAFPYVLFYILLWSTWLNTTNQSILMAFYCCIYLLLTVSHNFLSVSHMALMPDLVETYNQACDLSSWR
jgi:GPH family glycoside/pentoside/hexuronide:cation symporter